MTDGVININKPAGWTSQDVCSKLKHVLHVRKAGHTGTLDPMATGVLPVCIGKATRIIEYYGNDAKSYHAVMKLGIETDTLDITGQALRTSSYAEVSEKAIREAFKAYTGIVEQMPPKYSALMINGKRAYDLARSGEDFEIKPRKVTIYDNKVTRIDLEKGEIEFDVTCSKGTYIRTICDDIGRTLGCGAAMSALIRTASGYFRIEDSHTLEEVIEAAEKAGKSAEALPVLEKKMIQADEMLEKLMIPADVTLEKPMIPADVTLEKLMIPADVTLEKLGKISLNDNRITAFMNGNSTRSGGFRVSRPSYFDELYRVYAENRFLGVAAIENGSLIPKKVFR